MWFGCEFKLRVRQWAMTMRKTLLMTFLAFSIVFATLMTVLAYSHARAAFGAEIRRNLDSQALTVMQQVDAMLFEPVARSFHRSVGDALLRKPRQGGVQSRRIGRGVPQIDDAIRTDGAERANARGTLAGVRPNLSEEVDSRTLAVGAGDSDDRTRATRVEH